MVAHPLEGFGAQKGFALSLANGDWVLSIDADERVTPALAQEILEARVASGAADGYELPRRSSFCGRLMDHSGWSPDHVLRLFRRDKAHFSADLVHERVVCDGTMARLQGPLMHDPVRRLEDALSRMDRYSTPAPSSFSRPANGVVHVRDFHGLWTFIRTYVLRARLSRRPRRLPAGRRQCRGHLLPLHEGLAEGRSGEP